MTNQTTKLKIVRHFINISPLALIFIYGFSVVEFSFQDYYSYVKPMAFVAIPTLFLLKPIKNLLPSPASTKPAVFVITAQLIIIKAITDPVIFRDLFFACLPLIGLLVYFENYFDAPSQIESQGEEE